MIRTMLALAALCACGVIVAFLLFRDSPPDAAPQVLNAESSRASERAGDAATALDVSPAASREAVVAPARETVTVEPLHRKGPYIPTTRGIFVTLVSALDGATLGTKIDLRAMPIDAGGLITDVGGRAVAAFPKGTQFDLPFGRWKFLASIKGVEVGSQVVDANPGDTPLDVTITIDAVGPFTGKVLGPLGEIVSNASVHLRVVDPEGEASETFGFVASDTAGRFSIPALVWRPRTAISLTVARDDFARGSSVAIVSADGTTDKQPTLHLAQPLPDVVGRIVDSVGAPQGQIIVGVRATGAATVLRRVATNSDGSFRVRGLPGGSYELDIERRCLGSGSIAFVVDAAAPRIDLGNIEASMPTHELRLRIVDPQRVPLASVTVLADGIDVGRADREGRLSAMLCTTQPVDIMLSVPRAGISVTVRAGRFAPSDVEHEIVAGYAGITLRLRDRADPDAEIHFAQAQFVARHANREVRGVRMLVGGLLVIQEPDMKGSWQIDLAVDGYAKTNVAVEVDAESNAPPIDVWLEKIAE